MWLYSVAHEHLTPQHMSKDWTIMRFRQSPVPKSGGRPFSTPSCTFELIPRQDEEVAVEETDPRRYQANLAGWSVTELLWSTPVPLPDSTSSSPMHVPSSRAVGASPSNR